ncbi:MAG: dihydrodipicolinate synthase family protein [Opitutaceae bacterium]
MNRTDPKALRGAVVVPLATPLLPDGQPDEVGLQSVLDHIVNGGCRGVLVLGTTGEAASMPPENRRRITEVACRSLKGRAGAFIGIGDNCRATSIAYGRHALEAGADAVVAHPPSYYQVGAEELEAHYLALADQIDGPLFIYNIPSTTHHSIPLDTVERLSHHPRIVGIKDSEPNLDRLTRLAGMFRDRPDFAVLCGAALHSARTMEAGALGFVPSAGNLVPRLCRQLSDAALDGDFEKARQLQGQMDEVTGIYGKEKNLGRILPHLKGAMHLLGFGSGAVLPPLLPLLPTELETVRARMKGQGLL